MRRIAASLALLLAGSSLAIAGPAVAGDSASGLTTITMNVRGCEDCTIRPALLLIDADGKTQTYWGKPAPVRDGVAVMRVPTEKTQGMSFLISGAEPARINAQPVIVVQYGGQRAGSVVTRSEAIAAKRASGCWLGTTDAAVTLDVRATTVRQPTFPPDGTTTPVVMGWLVPTQKAPRTTGSFNPVYKGVLATQNSGYPCNAG